MTTVEAPDGRRGRSAVPGAVGEARRWTASVAGEMLGADGGRTCA